MYTMRVYNLNGVEIPVYHEEVKFSSFAHVKAAARYCLSYIGYAAYVVVYDNRDVPYFRCDWVGNRRKWSEC